MKNAFNKENGITMIALVVTIVILLILSGITIGTLSGDNGIVQKAGENSQLAQKETIIQKIEADLYNEKVKSGTTPNEGKLIEIGNEYGTVDSTNKKIITKDGGHEILFSEITGWK